MLFVNGNGTRGNYKCARGRTATYAYTRARVAGDCESQFATAGIRKAGSWIQPRGCVELIGCGGRTGPPPVYYHHIATGGVTFCIACRARKVSDIGDFNCARKIGLQRVRPARRKPISVKNDENERRAWKRTLGTRRMGFLVFLWLFP